MPYSTIQQHEWKAELQKSAERYHIPISWVAVVFNLIFGIGDYFIVPQHWQTFMIFRLVVSSLTAIGLLFRRKLNLNPDQVVFIPFMGLGLQNAYMYSVLDEAKIMNHTFAFMAPFIGAGMMLLWKPVYSVVVTGVTAVATIVCFYLFGSVSADKVIINGGMLLILVSIISVVLLNSRYKLTKNEIILRLKLDKTNQALLEQKFIVEQKNKDILDSIEYAKRIQLSLLQPYEVIQSYLPQSFLLFLGKDIVSGDFYWFKVKNDWVYIAAVDCTGHGVPGAFMSVMGNTLLNQIMAENPNAIMPDQILNQLHLKLNETLNRMGTSGDDKPRDGMDIGLCAIHTEKKEVVFAGANRPLYLVQNGVLEEIKGDKFPIGGNQYGEQEFTAKYFTLNAGDSFYISSDGYADQFGGTEEKKFMTKKFKSLIEQNISLTMNEQKEQFLAAHLEWKGKHEQTDDVLVIGIRL
jgi:serine phosphatase RsbU (regulator of sigma subunit)